MKRIRLLFTRNASGTGLLVTAVLMVLVALPSLGATGIEDLAAADGRHAGAEPVTALAHEVRGLRGAFHRSVSVLNRERTWNRGPTGGYLKPGL